MSKFIDDQAEAARSRRQGRFIPTTNLQAMNAQAGAEEAQADYPTGVRTSDQLVGTDRYWRAAYETTVAALREAERPMPAELTAAETEVADVLAGKRLPVTSVRAGYIGTAEIVVSVNVAEGADALQAQAWLSSMPKAIRTDAPSGEGGDVFVRVYFHRAGEIGRATLDGIVEAAGRLDPAQRGELLARLMPGEVTVIVTHPDIESAEASRITEVEVVGGRADLDLLGSQEAFTAELGPLPRTAMLVPPVTLLPGGDPRSELLARLTDGDPFDQTDLDQNPDLAPVMEEINTLRRLLTAMVNGEPVETGEIASPADVAAAALAGWVSAIEGIME